MSLLTELFSLSLNIYISKKTDIPIYKNVY